MRDASDLYKRLLADQDASREVKAIIADVEYGQDSIKACSTYCDTLPDFTVGECAARELDLTIEPNGTIPRAAKIRIFSRLVLGSVTSEWVPGGVFYVDTRAYDERSGWMMLHGLDDIMKTEFVWLDPSQGTGDWPMSQRGAVVDIAARIGVGIDPRTVIDPDYEVDYPNDNTMREVLCEIAAANGGNWYMTGNGELLLVPLGIVPPETSFLVDSEEGGTILFGDVRIIV